MAAGDFVVFEQFKQDLLDKVHNCGVDQYKLGLIDSVVTPLAGDTTPQWGVGSNKDYDGNEVTGSNYTAGGEVVSALFATSLVAGNGEWDPGTGPHLDLTQHVSGPNDIRWGILFNEDATNNEAVGFIDFGAVVSLIDGNITYTFDLTAITRIS